jgi:hypothetical protein
VDEPQSGGLDGGRTRACCGVAPTRLGGPEGDRLVGAEAPPPPSGRGHARGVRDVSKKLEQAVAEERAQHPDTPVEVWATDEHRIGLKPIIRRVWAPKGQRPIALGHHRYKWLYVTAFVQPTSGEVFWYVSNGVSKPFFAALLALFAREAGAGRDRILVLGKNIISNLCSSRTRIRSSFSSSNTRCICNIQENLRQENLRLLQQELL